MIDDHLGKAVFGGIGQTTRTAFYLDDTEITHTVFNLRIENNKLIGDVKPCGNAGSGVKSLLKKLNFRLAGFGVVDDNGVITEYTLTSIDAVKDGA